MQKWLAKHLGVACSVACTYSFADRRVRGPLKLGVAAALLPIQHDEKATCCVQYTTHPGYDPPRFAGPLSVYVCDRDTTIASYGSGMVMCPR